MNTILKIGLVTFNDAGELLVVRKRGGKTFILAGGKPEGAETDIAALAREVDEELGVTLASNPEYMGTYGAVAADMPTHMVMVRAYRGSLVGNPEPQNEIEELRWINPESPGVPIAESIANGVLPALRRK